MGALVGMWISASLVPLAMLRSFLGGVRHELREYARDERRFTWCDTEEEIERFQTRLAELRRRC
jgi:hypothetical protein